MADHFTPTQLAQGLFQVANQNFQRVSGATHPLNSMALGLQQTAMGLRELSIGLRATYILLDQVKRLLEQQQQRR